jgi:hypothetical protein
MRTNRERGWVDFNTPAKAAIVGLREPAREARAAASRGVYLGSEDPTASLSTASRHRVQAPQT